MDEIEQEDWRENDDETLFKKCEMIGAMLGIRRVGSMFEVKILSTNGRDGDIFVACAPFRDVAIDRCFQLYMEHSSCPSA